jgi:hypothetical protein
MLEREKMECSVYLMLVPVDWQILNTRVATGHGACVKFEIGRLDIANT